MKVSYITIFLISLIFLTDAPTFAQKKKQSQTSVAIDTSLFSGLKWRNIGPFRGGRSVAVAGIPDQPLTYYMGTTGGGMWKTEDAGNTWKNISDNFFATGSVGAIGISTSDPLIIYVGMGEHAVRGVMTSHGDGIYKSYDGGETWEHSGLPGSHHISDVIVHPKDPDVVYVSVQGPLYQTSNEKGIYGSRDGGKSWQKLLFIDEKYRGQQFSY